MLYFIRKYRALLFATALLFSGLVILTGTHENRRDLGVLDKLALDITSFFARGVAYGTGGIKGVWLRYVYLIGARAENEALRAEINGLKLKQAELAEAALEVERLRRLLGFREQVGFTVVPARVIGADVSGWFRTITIDRGSADGLERGMAVVTPDGIVGRTHAVAARSAKILLVTDANSSVDALVQRTRARGIVAGRVTPALEMRYVHRTEDVQVGDAVVTSGIGGVFPKGLPIGLVVSVEKTTGMFQAVGVSPAVNLSKLEEVLVITAHEGTQREALPAAALGVERPLGTPGAAERRR